MTVSTHYTKTVLKWQNLRIMGKHTETEFIIPNWFYKYLLSTYYVSGVTRGSNSSPLPSLLFFAVHRSKKQPEWESLGGFKIFTYIPKNTHQTSGWNAWANFSTERIVNNDIFFLQKHTHILFTFYSFYFKFTFCLLLCRVSAVVHTLPTVVVSLVPSTGSRVCGFSSCWWHMNLVAPRQVESSQTRDQTCVPCMSRQILNHGTTIGPQPWEVPHFIFVSLKPGSIQ